MVVAATPRPGEGRLLEVAGAGAHDRRMGRGWSVLGLLALLALPGCDAGDEPGVDAPPAWGPVTYVARIFPPDDTLGTLTARVDGEAATRITRSYRDLAAFEAARITFELLDGDTVVDRLTVSPMGNATSCPTIDEPTQIDHVMCGYRHGELRYHSISVQDTHGVCVGDALCRSRCDEGPCESGMKCASSFSSGALRYSRPDCVPAGDRLAGEACTYAAGADGRYTDDCSAATLCVGGTCRPRCSRGCSADEVCDTPAGHAPELTVCLPAGLPVE